MQDDRDLDVELKPTVLGELLTRVQNINGFLTTATADEIPAYAAKLLAIALEFLITREIKEEAARLNPLDTFRLDPLPGGQADQ